MTEISKLPTELILQSWRFGQTQAERLCAELLMVEGFTAIDPQCPLGGPDGLKDIVCKMGGLKYVAAAFFPTTPNTFADIKRKFEHDLTGVKANDASGIVFFTNQRLSPRERQALQELAQGIGFECVIYHMERIRALLDAPRGYGLRLEFLQIAMSQEEQLGFFGEWKNDVQAALRDHTAGLDRLTAEVSTLRGVTMSALGIKLPSAVSADIARAAVLSTASEVVSSRLTIDLLLMLHRAACIDIGTSGAVGALRRVNVWIGKESEGPQQAIFTPPPAQQVFDKLSVLLSAWNSEYPKLLDGTDPVKIAGIAAFHHALVALHPFHDGNGRVARILLTQQIIDLFGSRDSITLDQGAAYYNALRAADGGDFSQLRALVLRAVNM
jgi:fido (protein-threonine AMPylation protein)